MKNIAPFGSWRSLITSDLIVSQTMGFAGIASDGDAIYWLETRPQEGGRHVVVKYDRDGNTSDITPPGFNARTRVHEYGGGAFAVCDGSVYFANYKDQRIYKQADGQAPEPLTAQPPLDCGYRFADLIVDHHQNRLICILEDHTSRPGKPLPHHSDAGVQPASGDPKASLEPKLSDSPGKRLRHHSDAGGLPAPSNSIVAISLDGTGTMTPLAAGADFYASPKLSADGTMLAWLSWEHPNMPWDGTELNIGAFDQNGLLTNQQVLAGGLDESIFQPEWGQDGHLYFVSDKTDWWNLYRLKITIPASTPGADAEGTSAPPVASAAFGSNESFGSGEAGKMPRLPGGNADSGRAGFQPAPTEALCPLDAEFGRAQWIFGYSTYAFSSPNILVCTFNRDGIWHLGKIDLIAKRFTEIPTEYTDIVWLKAVQNKIIFCAASPKKPQAIVLFDPQTGAIKELRLSTNLTFDPETISQPEIIDFPTTGGLIAHAFYYPPCNPEFVAAADELPPLIVKCHGGPTSAASTMLNLTIQYWTSRGFAVVDVNYGGSIGFGRQYRQRLYGHWGVVDLDDCVNAALYLVKKGVVDSTRLLISGGSAGGYTTLCALTFRDVFAAGASYYGIGDLVALCGEDHKFESHSTARLVAPYPQDKEVYIARSPLHNVEQLSRPIIFFQGLEDKVVLPSQTESMVEAMRERRLPVAYLSFAGEQHGFRQAATIKRCLESELYFYSSILGFKLAETIEPVPIENLEQSAP